MLYLWFVVGVVVLVDDGCVVIGCNVENVLYGLILCVECVVVCVLYLIGGGWLFVLVCVDGYGFVLMLCG